MVKVLGYVGVACLAMASLGCAAGAPAKAPAQSASATAPTAEAAGSSEPPAVRPPPATGAQPAPSPAVPSPAEQRPRADAGNEEDTGACPAGMVLVEGDYCTLGSGHADEKAVEHQCLEEWYAEQNKKRVCEKFAEGKSKCVGKKVPKRYCIDRYEYPNVRGARAEVMNRFHQAQVKCAAQGKRMCTESEWTFACEGPDMKPFPYGYQRDPKKCNGDAEWDAPKMPKVAKRDEAELARLWQGVPSGQPECVSDFGVYDLPGNADEVVASETFEGGWRSKYESITTGGPWYKGVRNQCRPKIYTHDEGFYYYYLSFRCCAEPDGKPTDPLTPHQKKEGWDMKRVEGLAGVTVAEMKAVLEKKAKDPSCGCEAKDKRCRTLCGTLLGLEARDRKP